MLASIGLVAPAAGQAPPLGLYPAAAVNSDEDQLSDAEELIFGTDPNLKDTDSDGILDSDELLVTGTDPLLADTDADDLSDYEEWQALLPPRVTDGWDPETYLPQLNDMWWRTAHVTDYDGDGISDREEVMYGNPARYNYESSTRSGQPQVDEGYVWGKPGHWHATDYDRDGLDATEEATLQTDPYDPDTDGDGLRDGVDAMLGSALLKDSNANGVNDLEELMNYSGYSPNASWVSLNELVAESPLGGYDSDRDGISDVWETAHGLNPSDILDAYDDPDGDFLLNIEEFHARSDPQTLLSAVSQTVTIQAINPTTQLLETRAVVNDYEAVTGQPLPAGLVRDNGPISGYEYEDDWDGDGQRNRDEILATPARDPRLNESLDSDGDGLRDLWETLKGLNKTSADQDADSISDGADDFDGDGLTNLAEQSAGTHPLQADTDADSLPDGWEVSKGINALNSDQNSNSVLDDADDFDNDQLTNAEELTAGTHPLRADTDYDGLPDAWELANQLNPLSNSGIHGGSGDADGDGFSNAEELAAGSSPQSTGSTPPATFTFKSWYARAAGRNEDLTKVDVNITAQLEDGAPLPAPKVYNIVPPGTVVTVLNTAADTAALDMKALDYADDDATPGTSYDPDKIAGGDVRWTFLPLYPTPVPVAHIVAVKADFAWHNNTFDADYRRVRLEVKTAVAQVETRTYLIFTETEDQTTFQAVGSATFTLPAGAKKAKVTLSDNDNDANQDSLAPLGITVAQDDETLCLEPTFPDLTPSTTYVKRSVYLVEVNIEPDAGMVGVIGDVVKSFDSGSMVRHFVTPKKNADLNQDYVELVADHVTATEFDEWYVWEGGEAGSVANKRKVKRDAASKTEVKIKTKQHGLVAAQMTVWVVWVEIDALQETQFTIQVDIGPTNAKRTSTAVEWKYEGLIHPSAITGQVLDKPNLSGPPIGIPVPETTIGLHILDGFGYDNAKAKWDMSRQWRWRTNAPNLSGAELGIITTAPAFSDFPNTGTIHQTTPNQGTDKYPTHPLEGNDDSQGLHDPYNALPSGLLEDLDIIRSHVATQAGQVGSVVESLKQYREFARLEIQGKWYRISDYEIVRVHVKLKKKSESAAGHDLNADGDTDDEVWVDDGSVTDQTNQAW